MCRQIFEISKDQREQLILRIKESPKFAIQLDESMDITKMAHLWHMLDTFMTTTFMRIRVLSTIAWTYYRDG